MKPLHRFAASGLVLASIALLSPASWAAPPIAARVTATGVYGNGDVYVMLDTNIAESACPMARFDVPASSPALRGVLATAQLSLVTGKSVTVATSGCFGAFPTLDLNRGSYFYLNAN